MTTNHNVNHNSSASSSASQIYCDSVRGLNHGSASSAQSNPIPGQTVASTLFSNQGAAYPSLWSHHATINGHHATSENDWHVLRSGSDMQKFPGHAVDMPASSSFTSRSSLQPTYWQQLTGNVASFQAPAGSANYGHHGYNTSAGLVASGSMFGSASAGNGLWGSDYGSSMRRCNTSDLRPRPYSGDVITSLDMDTQEELPSNDDLEQFAKQFKQRRIKLGKQQ